MYRAAQTTLRGGRGVGGKGKKERHIVLICPKTFVPHVRLL